MRSRFFDTLCLTALVASVGLNLVQLRQARSLRDEASLQVGARMPAIEATRLDGVRDRIAVEGALPTLLYVFSPSCGWCDRNHASMNALAAALAGRYRVVGLSLTDRGLRDYLARNPLPFEVFVNPTAEAVSVYRMDRTPQTILLSSSGRVERVWQGAFAGRQQTEIEEYFRIRLPTLTIVTK
jgi:hypothetical protein